MSGGPLFSALERIGVHEHLCSLHWDAADRMAVAHAFLRIGLSRGERCIYVGRRGEIDALSAALAGEGADVARLARAGALVLRAPDEAYLAGGCLDGTALLRHWLDEAEEAARRGFSGLRTVGGTHWALAHRDAWLDYEGRLTAVTARCKCMSLCQYDGADHPAELLLAALQRHPGVIYDGAVCANQFYAPALERSEPGSSGRELRQALASIRDRGAMEDRLRRSEAYLSEGQKISHTGSWAWNAASGRLFWSDEHFRIFGLEPRADAPDPESVLAQVHPDDRARLRMAFEQSVRERTDYRMRARIVRPDGGVRLVESRARPVLDVSGHLVEYVGTIVDETERLQADAAVKKARAELAHVNRALTVAELTASIAHEVSQPLAAVVANARACRGWLAADPPNGEEALAALSRIERDATRASEVIRRLRALLVRREPLKASLDPGELIFDVMALVEGEARERKIALSASLEEGLPPLHADRIQLQQVLLNLLVNAIEVLGASAASRAIEVRARRGGRGVSIEVRDSGPGIDPRQLERVFEAFYSTKREGMGMGLAISRSIAQAHDGELRARNNEGGGASFELELPL